MLVSGLVLHHLLMQVRRISWQHQQNLDIYYSSIFFQLGSFSTKQTPSPECVCSVITILSLDVSAGRACSKSNLYRTTHLCRDLHRSNIWEQHDCYHIHGIQCQQHLLKDLYKTYYYAWTSNRAIFRHLYNKSSMPHVCQVIFGSWQMYLPFCHFSEN